VWASTERRSASSAALARLNVKRLSDCSIRGAGP
jgi:hypothetical protein